MDQNARIFVAGHRGLVGSALVRGLKRRGYTGVYGRTRAELDLRDRVAVRDFFSAQVPDVVLLAAARVGGILANSTYPADFIRENLEIELNVIEEARQHGVRRLLFLGSSCIYPRDCPQPIREDYLLTGPLEVTNRPYALAKLAGVEMCHAYNRQYGTRFLAVMPTNLYGLNDNYDLVGAHVIPALIRKFHEAKLSNSPRAVIWGTGRPRREFLFGDDLADACIFLLECPEDNLAPLFLEDRPPLVNIGCGQDVSISELAESISELVGFRGMLVYDESKPDGTPQKVLDISLLSELGWRARTGLSDGLKLVYRDFLEGYRT